MPMNAHMEAMGGGIFAKTAKHVHLQSALAGIPLRQTERWGGINGNRARGSNRDAAFWGATRSLKRNAESWERDAARHVATKTTRTTLIIVAAL